MADTSGETPISIKKISEKQNIPMPYVEQILGKLRRANLVESVRGPKGGYILNRTPPQSSIGAILRALEGPVALCDCFDPAFDERDCAQIDHCVTQMLWRQLGERIEEVFDGIHLDDLVRKANRREGTLEAIWSGEV